MNRCEKKLKRNKFNNDLRARDGCGCSFTTRVSRACDRNDSEQIGIPRVKRQCGKSAENRIKITGIGKKGGEAQM